MEVDGGRGGASCPRGVGSRGLAEKQDGLEIFQWHLLDGAMRNKWAGGELCVTRRDVSSRQRLKPKTRGARTGSEV